METTTDHDVLILDGYRAAATQVKEGCDSYKGCRIHALNGLHEFVAQKIKQVFPAGAGVLDVGAGSGAMSARLRDLGYKVTAIDAVPENFRLHETMPFIAANLNQPFAATLEGRIDGIVAVEIIEHLENPRHFLRECFSALKPGGHLILSTPNVDSPVSKSLFVRFGWFRYFDDSNYTSDGHIVPMNQWLLRKAIAESGFTIRSIETFGDPYKGMKWLSRTWLLARLIASLSPAEQKALSGEIVVAVLQSNNRGTMPSSN